MKIIDLINKFEEDCPLDLQEDWDNSGLQIDFSNESLRGIVIGLDLSKELLDFTIEKNCNFIFLHHPFFFESIKSLNFYGVRGKILEKIIKNKITVYSAHTNFDKVSFGVSDILANRLELKDIQTLLPVDEIGNGLGKFGVIEKQTLLNWAEKVKGLLGLPNLIIYGNLDRVISRVGVVGGSGSFAIDRAVQLELDLLITGDIKYHDGQKAMENNLAILDIGHYNSEIESTNYLLKYFSKIIEEPIFTYRFDVSNRKII
ncbi:Nif3-like dinuclear metal center hexameric protein [Lagierella sp.]|uniref:Nif3-like dinuclear metal center hexameric protein n=1 Tax=Lagierella sp. TaxID=2849657 RepID=UPI00260B5BFB|nr:Nif3-like dinuclear metal center hexameric protein [Lagierella sp.]